MSNPFERAPIAQAPLSVVLLVAPATANFQKVLSKWAAYLDTLGRDYEMFLVNYAGSGSTAEDSAALEGQYPRLKILPNPDPPGVGAALRSGLGAAHFPLFCYALCSHAYQAADLGRMLELIDKVDLVSGERAGQPRSWKRFVYRGLLRFLFGLRLVDVDCPFKLFRRSIFARIPIQSEGPFAHVEILAKANFLGCIMSDVPVQYSCKGRSVAELSSRRAWRTDASRVFFHPDFGPAVLPEQAVPAAAP
jgi:hypothetical protein